MTTVRNLLAALSLLLACACPSANASEAARDADAWRGYIEPLVRAGDELAARLPSPGDEQMRVELHRLLLSTIAYGYFGAVYQDVEHPDFWPFFNNAVFSFLFPNPDDVYHMAPIDPQGSYRLRGFRGTTRIVDFQIGAGKMYASGTGGIPEFGPTLANFDLDRDARIGKDGAFDILLSRTRPEGYKGDWWPLHPDTKILVVRQIAYDWLNEIDGRFSIERLDTPARKKPYTTEEMSARMQSLATYAIGWASASLDWREMLKRQGQPNTLKVVPRRNTGNMEDQRYIDGLFEIAPDEALILETDVPRDCRYWSFMLTNGLIVTLDAMHRQSSLNGHTAALDADGKFRAVIAASDPGVSNWLDTADNAEGVIYGRWKGCSSYPTPTLTKVKFAEVRQHLPAATPVVSAEARDRALRQRAAGAQYRRRW